MFIPGDSNHRDHQLNNRIKYMNREIIKIITDIRADNLSVYDRFFTYWNYSVAWQNKRYTDRTSLTDHGKRIMCTRLKDYISKNTTSASPTI